jgi:glutaredoxin
MSDLTIFTQPGCGYCNALKEFLRKQGIPFVDRDITTDRGAREELLNKYNVRATPFVVYGDQTMIGFDPVELRKILQSSPGGDTAEAK